MFDNAIATTLDEARYNGIEADLSIESGLIRTGVDGFYRFHESWPDAIADLTERVAEAVAARGAR